MAPVPGTAGSVRQVNENQCQQCMLLGGVIAFKGIAGAMALVHGSQGCSTYMRLTNVEHYNEPVDIASSSLNEKQTMGEDLDRIIRDYTTERGPTGVDIIPVPTPSYSGSHTEGFWAATKAIIAHYARPTEPHRRINVIIPHISPADIREIKRILALMGLEYTLLPDYSMTLDRPYGGKYQKIPSGGTQPVEIASMPGSPLTIQFGETCPDELSPGLWLQQEYNVPLVNLPLPIGLEATDRLMELLQKISGRNLPETLATERGWLLDGMADAHKYNAEGRPVIYGEPELVYAMTRVCTENGAIPAVIASGTRNSRLALCLEPLLAGLDEHPVLLEETDFATIEGAVLKTGANIAIGHSGGKFLTERYSIPLVRIGFPVHDRIGGQRILSAGYAGTLALLDRLTNTLLEAKCATYRQLRREEMNTIHITEGI